MAGKRDSSKDAGDSSGDNDIASSGAASIGAEDSGRSSDGHGVYPVSELAKSLRGNDVHIYAGARTAYGWDWYAYHYAKEWEMSEADFLQAVKLAGSYPGTDLLESAKARKV